MVILTVTAQAQITLPKDVLEHMGVEAGDKIHLHLLPDGRVLFKAAKPDGAFRDLRSMLKGKARRQQLSISQLQEAIAESGAIAGAGKE